MPQKPQLDPVYLHARREAWAILALWGLSFLWTLPYCYQHGYHSDDGQALQTFLGMPSWVMWGVALPWFVTGVIAILLCVYFIQDDDLGQADDEVTSETSEQQAGASA